MYAYPFAGPNRPSAILYLVKPSTPESAGIDLVGELPIAS